MIHTEPFTRTETTMIKTGITCDVCGTFYDLKSKDTDPMQVQEFQHIRFTGGYESVFGDDMRFRLDICQHCFKAKLGEYVREDR